MRYLVTGAAGFLGYHLSARLLRDGHQVVGLDNFHSGTEANIQALSVQAGFRFVRHDVTVPYDQAVDVVCNLACPASPPHYQKDPIYTAKIAFLGTLHALENAERHRAQLLQASTSEIYGDPLVHPQPEGYLGNVNSVGPRACYDEGKRLAETLCADFQRLGRVDARIVRIFNTYGPNMRLDDGRVMTEFITAALAGQPLRLDASGEQTRSFCYIDDLVDGLMLMMACPCCWSPINLGGGDEISLGELARLILEQTGSGAIIVTRPRRADDPLRRCPDATLAAEVLGWRSRIGLGEGLTRTVHWIGLTVGKN